jgi:serine protease AprX
MKPQLLAISLLAAALVLPGLATPFGLASSAPVSDGLRSLLASAAPDADVGVIVRFQDGAALQRFLPSVLDREGVLLPSVHAVAFHASVLELPALLAAPGVAYVEEDAVLPVLLSTATVASRAKAVWGPLLGGPIRDPSENVIDGSGVGIAVVDTGVDGSHPDLQDRMAANFKVVPTSISSSASGVFVPVQDSDTTSGHGTHVAGIAAGTGAASDGANRGAAPGAKIYGFGVGEVDRIVVASAAASFQWVLDHHDSVDPPIRVVTNSWGGTGAFNPASVISQLSDRLVDAGVVVLFAAGNAGGNGTTDQVNPYAKNPKPGVLNVANYNDENTGIRDGALAGSSSRGLASNASTWPDLAAPGSNITAAMSSTGTLSWLSKSLEVFDVLSAVFGPGNYLGNAINQHAGDVRFRIAGTTSGPAHLNWILYDEPVAVYNAHRNAYVAKGWTSDFLGSVDAEEAQAARFYAPLPAEGFGPLQPWTASQHFVGAGDALLLEKDGGSASQISVQVTSPAGTTRTLRPIFPCSSSRCNVTVDLAEHFGGEPADGTWIIAPGPTANEDPDLAFFTRPYVPMTGTSMATPHVAGIVALLFQADPELSPAEVEDILEDTAYEFSAGAPYEADPANPDDLGSFDKGHGLVDAREAVLRALES